MSPGEEQPVMRVLGRLEGKFDSALEDIAELKKAVDEIQKERNERRGRSMFFGVVGATFLAPVAVSVVVALILGSFLFTH